MDVARLLSELRQELSQVEQAIHLLGRIERPNTRTREGNAGHIQPSLCFDIGKRTSQSRLGVTPAGTLRRDRSRPHF
jgi:hypothetical protein